MDQINARIIKVIVPGMCPHCNKEFFVSQKVITPTLDWILKEQDLEDAKKKVIKEIVNAKIDETEKKMVLDWVNNPDTLFGPDEVDSILEQVSKKNELTNDSKNTDK
jgi:hypothetical protein